MSTTIKRANIIPFNWVVYPHFEDLDMVHVSEQFDFCGVKWRLRAEIVKDTVAFYQKGKMAGSKFYAISEDLDNGSQCLLFVPKLMHIDLHYAIVDMHAPEKPLQLVRNSDFLSVGN